MLSTFSAGSSRAFGLFGGNSIVELETEALINGLNNSSAITTSNLLNAGATLIIPANFWLWSAATSTPALIIDTPNATIENFGNIVGKGGGGRGGNAISITALGVTIINNSGAYIAGGGGSGAQGRNGGTGGGAGGGKASGTPNLGQTGANGSGASSGYGGGAGGGAGAVTWAGTGGSGQGGYILPGSGGSAGNGYAGSGGSGGNVGGNGTHYANDAGGPMNGSGGGGGWGARGGGNGITSVGSAGGKGIEANSNSYSLTNSGTIYGATS